MTYIHTDQGFVYLCVVLDLFARKLLAGKWPLKWIKT